MHEQQKVFKMSGDERRELNRINNVSVIGIQKEETISIHIHSFLVCHLFLNSNRFNLIGFTSK